MSNHVKTSDTVKAILTGEYLCEVGLPCFANAVPTSIEPHSVLQNSPRRCWDFWFLFLHLKLIYLLLIILFR